MAKRGRKRKNYFGPEHEDAVVRYLNCEDQDEKNLIYNTWLRKAFVKMIESIMRRDGLRPQGYTHDEILTDTLSHLISKMDRFNPDVNKKAFSYFTVICRNHMLGFKQKEDVARKRNLSFEEVFPTFEEDDDMTYSLSDTDYTNEELIVDIIVSIQDELAEEGVTKKKMNDNECKLGYALIDILSDWENIFSDMEGGSKYNKNTILSTMRDYTGMSTKDIRIAMKRYKKMYGLLKLTKIREGYM
jgi:hypothetical protein